MSVRRPFMESTNPGIPTLDVDLQKMKIRVKSKQKETI